MSVIFINYRRDDSAAYAGRIYDRLVNHFGRENCFMDIDHIAPGEDFKQVIQEKLSTVKIAVVLIGKQWLNSKDGNGQRRLDNSDDLVRLEIATLLTRNIRVIPVLVGGADMPDVTQLPESLVPLTSRNACEIIDTRFHTDVDRLIQALEKIVDTKNHPEQTKQNSISNSRENTNQIIQKTNSGDAYIHQGNGDINIGSTHIQNQTVNIGISLEEHEQRLEQREKEIRAKLAQFHAQERQTLEAELSDVQQALQDTTASYNALVADLRERIARLESQRDEWPGALFDRAIKALQDGDIKAADRLFEQALSAGEKLAAEGYFQRGKIAEEDYRYADAIQFYENSVRLQTENIKGWILLGNLYARTGELTKAENVYETVLSLAKNDQVNQSSAYNNLGIVYKTRGDLDKAVEFYQKSLAINEALGSKQGMAANYTGLGLVYETRGDLDKAVEFHEKALVIDEALDRKEGMASNYGNLGIVYRKRGDLDKAVEFYQKSLVISEALGSKEGMASNYTSLGAVYQIRGELDWAVEFYQRALAISEVLDKKEGMASNYGNLGIVYYIRGDLDKAVEYWKQSLALFTEIGAAREIERVQSLLDGMR